MSVRFGTARSILLARTFPGGPIQDAPRSPVPSAARRVKPFDVNIVAANRQGAERTAESGRFARISTSKGRFAMAETATPNGGKVASPRRRVQWMLGIGGMALLAALVYVHFFLYLPMGSGPAGPPLDAMAFERPWTERQVLLIGIGDSVTAGFGATKGHSYFDRLGSNPPDDFAELKGICLSRVLPNLKTLNLAISGSTNRSACRKPPCSESRPGTTTTTASRTCSPHRRPAR